MAEHFHVPQSKAEADPRRWPALFVLLLASFMKWHPIVRSDGTLSIARSYRPAEWPPILAEAGVEGRVYRSFPYRLCVERIR